MLLASPMVSVLAPSIVVPAPVIESMVLLPAIDRVPALVTPELPAMLPTPKARVLPEPIVVTPVYVLAPPRVSAPVPAVVSPPVPLMMPV